MGAPLAFLALALAAAAAARENSPRPSGSPEPPRAESPAPAPSPDLLPRCGLPRLGAGSAPSPGLDVHVHATGLRDPAAVDAMVEAAGAGLFGKALVLSHSYLATDAEEREAAALGVTVAELLAGYDAAVSAAAERAPERLRGLCGFAPGWDGARENARRCLRLPGMVGLKIRFASGLGLADGGARSSVESAVGLDGVKVVLMHLSTYEHARRDPAADSYAGFVARDQAEMDAVVELMAARPSVRFIVAHSAFGPSMVERLAERAELRGVSNHYIDTSHIMAAARDAPLIAGAPADPELFDCAYAQSWRRLGVSRVLFGSDIFVGRPPPPITGVKPSGSSPSRPAEFQEELQAVAGNPYLTGEEKALILRGNGDALWSALR